MNNISDYEAHKRDEEWDAAEDKRKSDPKRHSFLPNCGSLEGEDRCWWCGKPLIEHRQ